MTIRNTLPFAIIPEWLLDSDISAQAVRLYCILARYADKEGHAHPSRQKLAERTHISVKSVDRALRELTEAGAVAIQKVRHEAGDWDSNDYILTPGRDTGVATGRDMGDATVGTPVSRRTRAIEREPLERENYLALSAKNAFNAFWMVYPRHEGRAVAEKALTKALKKADIATITVAAARYRDDPNREDGYTLHGATWLNQERWNDPPLPVRSRPKRVGQSADLLRLAMED